MRTLARAAACLTFAEMILNLTVEIFFGARGTGFQGLWATGKNSWTCSSSRAFCLEFGEDFPIVLLFLLL